MNKLCIGITFLSVDLLISLQLNDVICRLTNGQVLGSHDASFIMLSVHFSQP
jgi:hypothetical protein